MKRAKDITVGETVFDRSQRFIVKKVRIDAELGWIAFLDTERRLLARGLPPGRIVKSKGMNESTVNYTAPLRFLDIDGGNNDLYELPNTWDKRYNPTQSQLAFKPEGQPASVQIREPEPVKILTAIAEKETAVKSQNDGSEERLRSLGSSI